MIELKDYSYQCNYCISRLVCLDRPKCVKCNFFDNEQFFKECIYSFGSYNVWKSNFDIIKQQQEENMSELK